MQQDTSLLEKPQLELGFIPLTDCAPLVIAREKGLFAAEGLDVTLSRESSWAAIRDKVGLGLLDGAQMLASMPLASRLGVCGPQLDFISAMVLDLNGNAITLNNALYDALYEIDPWVESDPLIATQTLKAVIDQGHRDKRPKLRFGIVYPCSTQSFELRYWLASGGIHPDEDIELVVIPPPKMVEAMREGNIQGFCVGEPWNTLAVQQQLGHVVANKYQLWNNSPEKVFAVTEHWAEQHPHTHQALLRALLKACAWLDQAQNRQHAARIISQAAYIALPEETVALSLTGQTLKHCDKPAEHCPDFHVFHRYSANFPWLSHPEWTIAQMYRWGRLTDPVDIARTIAQVYQPELYRQAAAALGIDAPRIDRKSEGNIDERMMMPQSQQLGPNQLLNGEVIPVGGILSYLDSLSFSQANLAELRVANPTSTHSDVAQS